jgi:hypothetical protein
MPSVTAEVVHPVSILDPMAMDIDATINAVKKVNVTDWVCFMKGRCYGCGLHEHQKKDGGHKQDVCNHCSKVGHWANVCQNKFFGKPGMTQAPACIRAATEESATPSTSALASMPNPSPASAEWVTSINALMVAMLEAQKFMLAEIAALKQGF